MAPRRWPPLGCKDGRRSLGAKSERAKERKSEWATTHTDDGRRPPSPTHRLAGADPGRPPRHAPYPYLQSPPAPARAGGRNQPSNTPHHPNRPRPHAPRPRPRPPRPGADEPQPGGRLCGAGRARRGKKDEKRESAGPVLNLHLISIHLISLSLFSGRRRGLPPARGRAARRGLRPAGRR